MSSTAAISPASSFLLAYTQEVSASLFNDLSDNYDEERFGRQAGMSPLVGRAKQRVRDLLMLFGLQRVTDTSDTVRRAYEYLAPRLSQLEWLIGRLADEESKKLLVKLIAYRALGHRKIRIPFNTPEMIQALKDVTALASKDKGLDAGFMGWTLKRFDLKPLGLPLTIYQVPTGVFTICVAQQYRCDCRPRPVEVSPGDTVIDGGGCWGDSALYFAQRAGSDGRVFTFEFVEPNLEIMSQNLALNPTVRNQIEVVERALWERSGEEVRYQDNGPGTRVSSDGSGQSAKSVVTLSIDDMVREKNVPRIDFIKMDIEGSELSALKGAETTLRRFKPKLAICVYHRLEDFFDIPAYLESLCLGYRFHLRHFTIHAEETVLYASVE
jgi:FkbM family methyltransferase